MISHLVGFSDVNPSYLHPYLSWQKSRMGIIFLHYMVTTYKKKSLLGFFFFYLKKWSYKHTLQIYFFLFYLIYFFFFVLLCIWIMQKTELWTWTYLCKKEGKIILITEKVSTSCVRPNNDLDTFMKGQPTRLPFNHTLVSIETFQLKFLILLKHFLHNNR